MMKRVLPILVSIVLVVIFGAGAYYYLEETPSQKESTKELEKFKLESDFIKRSRCKRMPLFLKRVSRAGIYIDLSQKSYKGIAFWYGKSTKRAIYSKKWGEFGHFGTYTLDRYGNLYLAPNPFISIESGTFEAQKWIYKLDSRSGEIKRWLRLDEVSPSGANPYGVISLDYDCSDSSLWVSTIDKSSYNQKMGRIYKIKTDNKKILKVYSGYDFLTVKVVNTLKSKYLFGGSAMEPYLYAWEMIDGELINKPKIVLELPDSTLRVRKIHILSKNALKIEAIPFSYTLIAQSSDSYREYFIATWDKMGSKWIIKKK